jgi:N-acetylneuraminate synthase
MKPVPALIEIGNRRIAPGYPVYVIAEMSANHGQSFAQAVKILEAAMQSGANAIKLQTYTPETLTIDSDKEFFNVSGGTLWDGRHLYDLYKEAYTPWEWQPKLKKIADGLGLDLFSTPFDDTAVSFLEEMEVPAHKIASFEVVDLPLIRRIARTGKAAIMSTGMATLTEIDEAVRVFQEAGGKQLALLKCTSAYPAPPEDINLLTIPHLSQAFNLPVGISDHTLGIAVPVAAVALGACIVEKHFTLSRNTPGPDSAFSLEPHEFKEMVEAIRTAEKALGQVYYGVSQNEAGSRVFRRSLFVVADTKAGEIFTPSNIRSIRPGHGLHTRHFEEILGRSAMRDIERGTPLSWEMVGERKVEQSQYAEQRKTPNPEPTWPASDL